MHPAFYAVQTLLQLFPPFVYRPVYEPDQYASARYASLPCVDITDYPVFLPRHDAGREPAVLHSRLRQEVPGLDGRPQAEPFSLASGR